MFSILSNGTIRITKGDSGRITLYVNKGTQLEPERYEFTNTYTVTKSSDISYVSVTLDFDTWKSKVFVAGTYTFTVTNNVDLDTKYWSLNSKSVDIAEYGLTVGTPVAQLPTGAQVVVTYVLSDVGNEVYFNVWHVNQTEGTPVISKTIKPGYNTVLTSINGETAVAEQRNCTTGDGDLIIALNPSDTESMLAGEFNYTIKVKLLHNSEYITSTICGRTPFVIGA